MRILKKTARPKAVSHAPHVYHAPRRAPSAHLPRLELHSGLGPPSGLGGCKAHPPFLFSPAYLGISSYTVLTQKTNICGALSGPETLPVGDRQISRAAELAP